MRALVLSEFVCEHDMDGAMPGEPLYLSALGVTTIPIPGQLCGNYHSHEGRLVKMWATLVIDGPWHLLRCEA